MRGLIIFLAMWSLGCTLPAFEEIKEINKGVTPQNTFVDCIQVDTFCPCNSLEYTEKIGVVVLAGQSNYNMPSAYVADIPNGITTPPEMYIANVNSVTAIVEVYDPPTNATNNRQGINFGFEHNAGRVVAPYFDKIVFIKYGEGGVQLNEEGDRDFNVNSVGEAYDTTIARVNRALAEIETVFPVADLMMAGYIWVHGEADSQDLPGCPRANNYYQNLTDLKNSIRGTYDNRYGSGYVPPFVITEISSGVSPCKPVVNAAQIQVANEDINGHFVGTQDLTFEDGIHYDSQSGLKGGYSVGLKLIPTK